MAVMENGTLAESRRSACVGCGAAGAAERKAGKNRRQIRLSPRGIKNIWLGQGRQRHKKKKKNFLAKSPVSTKRGQDRKERQCQSPNKQLA